MKHIVIVGAGQIGSRHLQGIAKSEFPKKFTLVDPNLSTLEIAKNRFYEVVPKGEIDINAVQTLQEVSGEVDLGVICTPANIRAAIIKEFLELYNPKGLVLEKVLFQKLSEYDEIDQLLKSRDIPTWVNCARRLMPIYQELQPKFITAAKVNMHVSGNDLGLGCNGVHFLDLFAFLTGGPIEKLTNFALDPICVESKREGFKEFTGAVLGTSANHDSVTISSSKGLGEGCQISITSENERWVVSETNAGFSAVSLIGNKDGISSKLVAISDLATIYFDNLVKTGDSGLTKYEDSIKIHKPFLEVLIKHLNEGGDANWGHCPIT